MEESCEILYRLSVYSTGCLPQITCRSAVFPGPDPRSIYTQSVCKCELLAGLQESLKWVKEYFPRSSKQPTGRHPSPMKFHLSIFVSCSWKILKNPWEIPRKSFESSAELLVMRVINCWEINRSRSRRFSCEVVTVNFFRSCKRSAIAILRAAHLL